MDGLERGKADLRKRMREEAQRHSAQDHAEASRRICDRIRSQTAWKNATKVLLFVPTSHEPDIWPLAQDGKHVCLPAFNEKLGRYEARRIQGEQDLVVGQFGIREPNSTCSLTDLDTLDLVLAPGLAFGLDGSRLGRGKGYYDRLLEKLRATKIGVCFEWQLQPQIPCDGHDVAMDYIATPDRWLSVAA